MKVLLALVFVVGIGVAVKNCHEKLSCVECLKNGCQYQYSFTDSHCSGQKVNLKEFQFRVVKIEKCEEDAPAAPTKSTVVERSTAPQSKEPTKATPTKAFVPSGKEPLALPTTKGKPLALPSTGNATEFSKKEFRAQLADVHCKEYVLMRRIMRRRKIISAAKEKEIYNKCIQNF